MKKTLLTLCMILAVTAATAMAETVTIRQGLDGYAGCQDTQIWGSGGAEYSYGPQGVMEISYPYGAGCAAKAGLVQFADIFDSEGGPIPDGDDVIITNATLRLYCVGRTDNSGDDTMRLNAYPMLVSWDASETLGYYVTGTTCYGYRAYPVDDQNPTLAECWGTAGVIAPNGPTAPYDFTTSSTYLAYVDANGTVADDPCDPLVMDFNITNTMEAWLDGTLDNEGVFLGGTYCWDIMRIASADHSYESIRPELIVTYYDLSIPDAIPGEKAVFVQGVDGYTSSADTWLYTHDASVVATWNYGASGKMEVSYPWSTCSKRAGLIIFNDIFGSGAGQVPTEEILITSAKLYLRMYEQYDSGSHASQEFYAYPMLTEWEEGTKSGSAEEGASCGEARYYRSDGDYATYPDDAWGTGGVATQGPVWNVDVDSSIKATQPMPEGMIGPSYGSIFEPVEFDVTQHVQAWYSGAIENNGLFLRSKYCYDKQSYYTSDSTYEGARPILVIEYQDFSYTPDPCEVVFQNGRDGYDGTEDTMVSNNYPTGNYGGRTNFEMSTDFVPDCYQEFSLLRFNDLFGTGPGQVPLATPEAYTVVTEAKLRLYAFEVYDAYSGAYDLNMIVAPMLTDWAEGSANGTAQDGASCHNYRYYRTDPCAYVTGDYWGNAGAVETGPVGGVDYASYLNTTLTLPGTVAGTEGSTFELMEFDITGIVQGWQSGAMDNNGLLLKGFWCYHKAFVYSSDSPIAAVRPMLTVKYDVIEPYVPAPGEIVFQDGFDGYDGTADTGLTEGLAPGYNNANNGAAQSMRISHASYDHDHALLRFDNIFGQNEGQIPGGSGLVFDEDVAIISSAKLRLYSYYQHVQSHTDGMKIWVAPMLTDFVEGSSVATAEPGASCRYARHYRSDGLYAANPADAWGTAGASTSDGPVIYVDYAWDASMRGYINIANAEIPGSFGFDFRLIEIDVTSIVQAWNDGVIPNKGFRLSSNYGYDYWDVYTSDYSVAPYRPMLIVTYDTIRHDVPADTLVFKQGWEDYDGTEDLRIQRYNPGPSNWNYGAVNYCSINNPTYYGSSSLIRFNDIFGNGARQIPYDADIYVATVRLWTYNWTHLANNGQPYQSELEMQPMVHGWTEGNSNAANPPIEGESCQAARHYRADGEYANNPDDAWGYNQQIPANGPLAGYDFEDPNYATDLGVITQMPTWQEIDPNTTVGVANGVWMEWDVTTIVKLWQAGSLPNEGLYAFQNLWYWDGVDFASSENSNAVWRPELQITYRAFTCGHSAVPYPTADAGGPQGKRDCYVDEYDVMQLAEDWLGCTMPDVDGCVDLSGGQLYIAQADITVDADLTEWADATWFNMGYVYYGDPCDLGTGVGDVKFAVKWDDADNKVCAAVQVVDYDHVLETVPTNWNTSDRIEIYAQGDANGGVGWGYVQDGLPNYDKAQQYAVGYNPSIFNTTWGRFGNGRFLGSVGLQYRATADGDTIIYEIGVPMYIWYGGISDPGDPGKTISKNLTIGDIVGFDLVVNSKRADGFGMRSQNDMVGKFNNADQFLRWELVGETCGPWGLYAGRCRCQL